MLNHLIINLVVRVVKFIMVVLVVKITVVIKIMVQFARLAKLVIEYLLCLVNSEY